MKILFVKPHWKWCETKYGAPPVGLLLLSSSVKKRFPEVQTRLIDLRLKKKRLESFKTNLRDYKPDIIAIMALTGDEPVIKQLSETAKTIDPKIHVSCGGPLPTTNPEDIVNFKNIDSIIRGEGEKTFTSLVKILLSKNITIDEPVTGLSIKDPNGFLAIPEKSPPINNLDQLPLPDWDLISINEYSESIQMNGVLSGKRYMPIFTSRGCPYKCAFCHNIFGTNTRFRSAENVVGEIKILVKKYSVDEIQIFDDIFNLDRKRLLKICDLIIAEKLNIKISFPNGLRGDRLDNEMILKLQQAGTYMITFAIESASPRIQKLVNKNLNIEKTMAAIRYANSIGLITKSFFMVGFPGETKSEIKKTLDFAVNSPLTTIVIFMVVPFKGTKVYNIAKKIIPASASKLLETPFDFYFSSKTFYTEMTGVNLKHKITLAYLRFFTPLRLFRFYLKIPRKKLYLSHLKTVISVLFMPKQHKNE